MPTMSHLKLLLPLLVPLMLAFPHPAQSDEGLSPVERKFLDILTADSTSSLVLYNLRNFEFGIRQPYGSLIVVKSGRDNYLVEEGSEHVYRIEKEGYDYRLRRINTRRHSTGIFEMMLFIRNKQIHSLGGYGFWRNREFFSSFDTASGLWHPLPSRKSLATQRGRYYHDAASDKFYLLGRNYEDNFQRLDYRFKDDSIHIYDFRKSAWTSAGKLEENEWTDPKHAFVELSWMFLTDFGIIHIMNEKKFLVDPGHNAIYTGKAARMVKYLPMIMGFRNCVVGQSMAFHMGDTAYLVCACVDSVATYRTSMTRADFEDVPIARIYRPITLIDRWKSGLAGPEGWLTLSLIFTAALATAWQVRKRKKLSLKFSGTQQQHQVTSAGNGTTGSETASPLLAETGSLFLESLTKAEASLVKSLLVMSMQGEKMNTETMNRILGVGKKDTNIQKNLRSRSVKNINQAYSLILHGKGQLVSRDRSASDKRNFHYFIGEEHFGTLHASIRDMENA